MDTQQTASNMRDVFTSIKKADFNQIIACVLTIVIGMILTKLILRFLNKFLQRVRKDNATVYTLLNGAVRVILYSIVILSAANAIGMPMTSFLALFSVAGLAISLSVQGLLSSFAGGIIILMSKPFTEGDFILADNIEGTVREITFIQTHLESPDGKRIYIPNSKLYTSRIVNYTINGKRRIELDFSASYDNSPEEVRTAILAATKKVDSVLRDPAPRVILQRYADSDIEYTLWAWVKSESFLDAKYALNELMYDSFKKHGVEMTYPHLNVYLRDGGEKHVS